jgi:DNA-binding transcriptional regulator YiaG
VGTRIEYVWTSRDISLDIEMVDGDEVIVVLATPAGTLRIAGGVSRRERVLHVKRAHIEGLEPGALGRAGLGAFFDKIDPTTLAILFDFAHDLVQKVCNFSGSSANAIGRKLLEEADVDEIIIEGSVRATGRNPGRAPERSTFPIVKLVLSVDSVDQPVTVIRLLATHGLGLKKAHAAMDRLAERGCIALEVPTDDPESVVAELSRLNVHAAVMETPEVDVKSVRQQQGLSQSEFATLYGIDEDTLKNWEQGRNEPDGPAKVLLAVIKNFQGDWSP